MSQGNIENFAIIVLVNGRTSQVELTTSQKRLFSKLTLGALNDSGPLKLMPIDDIVQLQPDAEAFSDGGPL
ncbi:hypothetical protein GQ299_004100 [Salmonella enterica subsp. enterica serovar Newport]|uniref:Uncharacterized protein n=2 Tax=Salmonella enterica I TaxID=59201 RepID=A0A619AF83_SALET|nr:hypothetical protein [Salmonella enterica]EAA1658636.1 hypothetical protein [Salmonella enterica subsp. enterica serovar Newport]EBU9022395.1 hypothetical protein [Salmonella enterica subsp. enterica serovar Ullevi]EBV0778316.1 hypothetical protein [Salmonella enterica subsp. enterica serovar Saintpaul]EBW4158426.1 hypothetical protein [Salmonella enterica subsp. enterica serovar Adelaide]EBX6685500.1 hypothetical protein [Salmonella enterica subsp. salamae serovar Sofia]EBX9739584.1 hypot